MSKHDDLVLDFEVNKVLVEASFEHLWDDVERFTQLGLVKALKLLDGRFDDDNYAEKHPELIIALTNQMCQYFTHSAYQKVIDYTSLRVVTAINSIYKRKLKKRKIVFEIKKSRN